LFPAEKIEGRSGFPKNVLDSTSPVILFWVEIVLTLPTTETFTISLAEIYVSRYPLMQPSLFLLISIRVSSEWTSVTANWAVRRQPVTLQREQRGLLADEKKHARLAAFGNQM